MSCGNEDNVDRLVVELQEAFRGGDTSAINSLLERLNPVIVEAVRRRCRQMHSCLPPGLDDEELVQEVWVRLRTSKGPTRETGRPAVSLRAWVNTTTTNLIIDSKRRDRWLDRKQIDDDGNVQRTASAGASVAARAEKGVFLAQAINGLRRDYPVGARLLELKARSPWLTPEELAAALSISRAYVDQVWHRVQEWLVDFRRCQE